MEQERNVNPWNAKCDRRKAAGEWQNREVWEQPIKLKRRSTDLLEQKSGITGNFFASTHVGAPPALTQAQVDALLSLDGATIANTLVSRALGDIGNMAPRFDARKAEYVGNDALMHGPDVTEAGRAALEQVIAETPLSKRLDRSTTYDAGTQRCREEIAKLEAMAGGAKGLGPKLDLTTIAVVVTEILKEVQALRADLKALQQPVAPGTEWAEVPYQRTVL